MQISVKGKQIDVGSSLRDHVNANLSEIVERYFSRPLDAQVVFSREAHLFRADISVHAGRGVVVQGNAAANDPYPAFDQAAARIAKRLQRHKGRLIKTHHHNDQVPDPADMLANQYILDGEGEGKLSAEGLNEPIVIAEMTTPVTSLTVSEAVMRLDLEDLPALMFKNKAHGGLNMIYRRADGNIGWVDPSNNKVALS